eukprot:TRINITY_DN50140_c0_g1_i1.p1 TRINITY_DN50140_c0_g1~~TRINITY_DN50140_c0_g1_i1.p1  ORF type:complete len:660 (+),score=172.19 TRINITY_DN50140_c0_g1_i1:96-1982(+)
MARDLTQLQLPSSNFGSPSDWALAPGMPRVLSAGGGPGGSPLPGSVTHLSPTGPQGQVFHTHSAAELPAEVSRVLVEARAGHSLVGVFGSSDDSQPYSELQHAVRMSPESRPFVDRCAEGLRELLHGLELATWLDDPQSVPDPSYFVQPAVEWPICTLAMLTKWHALCIGAAANGWEWRELRQCFDGLSGFGKGLIAAAVASASDDEEELLRRSTMGVRAAFWVGLAMQENHTSSNLPTILECQCVLAWRNIPLPVMEELLATVNRVPESTDVRTHSALELAHVLSLRSGTVVGHPSDLRRLENLIQVFVLRSGTRANLTRLPAGAPAHSEYYCNRVMREVVNLWRDDGLEWEAQDLALEIISPATGRPIGERGDPLSAELAELCTLHTHSLLPLASMIPDEGRLVDFGPTASHSSMPLISSWLLAQAGPAAAIRAVTHPRGSAVEAEHLTPRRSSKGHVRRATLEKTALINELLYAQGVLGRYRPRQSVDLLTTWGELGLVERDDSGATGDPADARDRDDVTIDSDCRVSVRMGWPLGPWGEKYVCKALTGAGLRFTNALGDMIGRQLPSALLIVCPTVLAVMELWDCYVQLDAARLGGKTGSHEALEHAAGAAGPAKGRRASLFTS